jgi:RNA polymerase sigma-70 factor, ECF subfamily
MDSGLVARAQRGDRDAFERLAIESVARLHAVATSVLGDASLAEDATQQALLSIWRDLPTLRDVAKFEAWSYRVLMRACMAERSRARRWGPTIAALPPGVAPDWVGAVENRDRLERAFQALSLEQRAVVTLHHVVDLQLDRVAEILGIPKGTAHSRLHRAMETLRGALDADVAHVVEPAPAGPGR